MGGARVCRTAAAASSNEAPLWDGIGLWLSGFCPPFLIWMPVAAGMLRCIRPDERLSPPLCPLFQPALLSLPTASPRTLGLPCILHAASSQSRRLVSQLPTGPAWAISSSSSLSRWMAAPPCFLPPFLSRHCSISAMPSFSGSLPQGSASSASSSYRKEPLSSIGRGSGCWKKRRG